MTVINTNVNSLMAQNAISKNSRSLNDAMDQLSTGKRINSAADDAAGLAISNRMTSQIKGLDQAVRNASDGIALLQTAEGATIEITDMLQRMRELAVQSSNDTYTDAERTYLNLEFQQLNAEMTRIASNTQWNGMEILDGVNNSFNFQVGANANQTIDIDISDLRNLLPTEATAQVGTFAVGNDLAGGANATVTVNGTTYTITGTVSAGQVETGNYTVNNALGAGEVATLTLGGETFTVSGDAATAQQATATLNPGASFASTDTMSVTVNGQSFVVYGQQHTATTGREAAAALASAINTAANQAQVAKFQIGSTTTASGVFTLSVNGTAYTVNGSEHNATTASGIAVALASKINENPLARMATATVSNAQLTATNVLSVTINGITYYLASATGTASTDVAALASIINGAAVAQVDTVTMTTKANTTSAAVVVNGNTYTLLSNAGGLTAAGTASALAAKINGNDIAQVDRFSMAALSVNVNMNLGLTVNGTKYSVAAVDHVAITQASGMALLANAINAGQTAVSAIVSVDVLTLRAAVAGTAFSVGSLSVGTQAARTGTQIVANNTAQTAVSATVSGAVITLTALTAGTAFSSDGGNRATASATTTYNNVVASGFSASMSTSGTTAALVLTATTAGTTFSNGTGLNVNGTDYSFTETRPNSEGQTAVTATVSGAYVILTANTAGTAFSVGNAAVQHLEEHRFSVHTYGNLGGNSFTLSINGTRYGITSATMDTLMTGATAASAAQVVANRLNNGAEATKWTVQVGAITNTSAFSIAVNGNDLSVNVGSAQTAAQLAARFASVANADSGISADILARASGAYLVLSARTAAFDIISAVTSVGTVGGAAVAGVAAARVADGQAALDGVSATVTTSGGTSYLVLTGTTAGYDFSIANYTMSTGTEHTAIAVGPGFSATVSNTVANLTAQSAVSATVSGAYLILTATTAGSGFSIGGVGLASQTFSATTTTNNVVGGYTASQVATQLASLAQSGLSAVSVNANGATINATALNTNTAFSSGVLNDGTDFVSFNMTASANAGGTTATSVLASFASAISNTTSALTTAVSAGGLFVRAAAAGTAFSAAAMSYAGNSVDFETITENATYGYTISTYDDAQATLQKLDDTMLVINGERAKIGAVVNRLEYAIDNLRNVSMNTKASRSQILDADYAEQSTELARTQIIQQAATSVLAQANSTQESVLKLLQ